MQNFSSTKQVAKVLGVKPDLLSKAIWLVRVKAPVKGPGGAYLWTGKDIESAAWALGKSEQIHIINLMEKLEGGTA